MAAKRHKRRKKELLSGGTRILVRERWGQNTERVWRSVIGEDIADACVHGVLRCCAAFAARDVHELTPPPPRNPASESGAAARALQERKRPAESAQSARGSCE